MRTLGIPAVVLALLTLGVGPARADGLHYQLPEDGAWVRFDIEGSRGPEGMKVELEGSLKMASVGRTRVGDEDCRWIELEWNLEEGRNSVAVIAKVLVPERYLKEGESPLDHIVRGWARVDDGPPQDVDANPIAPHMLPGALEIDNLTLADFGKDAVSALPDHN